MPRFTFKKTERLSSLKAIDQLFQEGKSFYAGDFKCVYVLHNTPQPAPCQVVFSVPKRNFKRAVDRNRLKRCMREGYRLNKHLLYEALMEKQNNMHLLIIYTAKGLRDQEAIASGIVNLLKTLAGKTTN